MNSFNFFLTLLPIVSLLLFLHNVPCEAQLSTTFYDSTCPNATTIIRNSIRRAISRELRMAASLIRLHFHDCFVQGCDASILLDETPTIKSEKTASPNYNSVRGYHVIEAAKRKVERVCPGVVSCADILTLAARDASVAVGGPSWNVKLGRRDSTTANFSQALADLPSASFDVHNLTYAFRKKGLKLRDMVALSGAHTLGQARCLLFRDRIYNETDIDAGFARIRRRRCPRTGGDSNLAPLDLVTPNYFDNNYFRNLMQKKGLLHSDQVLTSARQTNNIVSKYSRKPRKFKSDFAKAMIKMSKIQPLVGQNGIVRRICSAIN